MKIQVLRDQNKCVIVLECRPEMCDTIVNMLQAYTRTINIVRNLEELLQLLVPA